MDGARTHSRRAPTALIVHGSFPIRVRTARRSMIKTQVVLLGTGTPGPDPARSGSPSPTRSNIAVAAMSSSMKPIHNTRTIEFHGLARYRLEHQISLEGAGRTGKQSEASIIGPLSQVQGPLRTGPRTRKGPCSTKSAGFYKGEIRDRLRP